MARFKKGDPKAAEAGRKGGQAKVKKGFAVNPKLASEAGKKGKKYGNAQD
jgi:general stress protein YciG